MSGVLAKYGMKLECVNDEYRKKGGMEFCLLHEKECSLVVNFKLTNHEGDCWRHFVAWDGNVIYDYPKNCKVNATLTVLQREARLYLRRRSSCHT